jgi:hypothetical protein
MRATSLPRWVSSLFVGVCVAALLWILPLFTTRHILFPAGPNFADITVYKGRFSVYHTARFFTSRAFSGFAYPPGAAPIYEAFYRTANATQSYLTLAAGTVLAAGVAAWVALRRLGLSRYMPALLLFSFPLVFLIQRANIEIMLWIAVALGLVAYRGGFAVVAAVLFGLAAAVKLYPIFLLGLFSKRRRDLTAFTVGVVTAVAALVGATAYAGPTFVMAARGFTTGIGHFQDHYVDTVSVVEVMYDHSLFSPLKYVAYAHHESPGPWTHWYYLIAGGVTLLLFLRVRTMPSVNRVLFLVAAMVCLPPVSFAYTLVHLYVPALLLLGVVLGAQTRVPVTAAVTLALLVLLLLPLVSLNVLQMMPTGPMQSVILFGVMVLATAVPWPEDAQHFAGGVFI